MKRLVYLSRRVRPLLRLATEYTAAHMSARILASVSGLMLVRLLAVSEYGFYTLLLSAFGFICTFSDLGATETLSYFRRRAAVKNKTWSHYYDAVMRFRRTLFIFGFFVSSVYVFYTARHIEWDMASTFAGIAIMGFASWYAIQFGIISYVLKLEQRFRQVYALELANEGVKLVAVLLIWALGLTTALAGMTGIALGALVSSVFAARLFGYLSVPVDRPNKRRAYRSSRALFGQIMPILPGTIHFTLQGPLVAWLAAYFGSVVIVAEVGALGRLGVLLGVIAGFTGTVFVPRLLAISDEKVFFRRYCYWWVVILMLGSIMMLVVMAFPEALLYVLGSSYSSLKNELVISAATAVVASWGAFSWHINRARGWAKYQIYRVPFILVGQIPMFFLLDFSTTRGVLLFSLGSIALDFVFQTLISIYGFRMAHTQMKRVAHA